MLQAIPTSPGDFIEGAIQWLADNVAPHVENLVDQFNTMIFSIPAPGVPTDPMTWIEPTNGIWPTVWEFHMFFVGIAYLILILGLFASFTTDDEVKRRKYHKGIIRAGILNFFLFLIAAAFLHLGNAFSMAFVPSGAEFMATPGDVARLGIGLPIGIAMLIYNAGAVLLGLLFVFVYYFAIHATTACLPIFATFRELPQSNIRAVGEFGIATFITLVFIKVFQTALLRFAFEIPWDVPGVDPLLTGAIGIATSVAIAMVFVPVAGFYKLMPSAMMMVGGGALLSKTQTVTRNAAREGAYRGYERIHSTTHTKEETTRKVGRVSNNYRNENTSNGGHTKN